MFECQCFIITCIKHKQGGNTLWLTEWIGSYCFGFHQLGLRCFIVLSSESIQIINIYCCLNWLHMHIVIFCSSVCGRKDQLQIFENVLILLVSTYFGGYLQACCRPALARVIGTFWHTQTALFLKHPTERNKNRAGVWIVEIIVFVLKLDLHANETEFKANCCTTNLSLG